MQNAKTTEGLEEKVKSAKASEKIEEKVESAESSEKIEEKVSMTHGEKLNEADGIIKNNVMLAMGASTVPVPLFDLVALSGVQLNMIHSLCKLYDLEFRKDLVKSFIASFGTGLLAVPVAMGLSSLVKFIPVVGQTAGIVSMSASGSAFTYAIGKVFVKHFSCGGTILNFNPDSVRDYFKKEFESEKENTQKAA